MAERDPAAMTAAWFDAACRLDGAALRRLLDEGVDVNLRDAHGQTALFHAVAPFGGNLRVVKLLVDAGAALDVINDRGEDVLTAGFAGVTAALENASMRAIEAFLLEAGFDPAIRRR